MYKGAFVDEMGILQATRLKNLCHSLYNADSSSVPDTVRILFCFVNRQSASVN